MASEVISPKRARWERATAVPMMVMAAAFIAAYSFIVLAPDAIGAWRGVLAATIAISWVVFLIDYLVRLALSRGHRWVFVRANLLDLLAVAIPLFRAFKLLRSLREIDYFRRRSGAAVRTQIAIYAVSFAVLFIYMISLAELQVERDAPGATITTFGDAVWWACVTMATVGYGDTYPVTGAGRVLAVFLMIGGVVIVGTASATVISYLNEKVARGHQRPDDGDAESVER